MKLALSSLTGHLLLPSGRSLTPDLHPDTVGTLGPAHLPTQRDLHNGWMWYDLRFEAPPWRLGLSLSFEGASLRTCHFGLPTTAPPASSWANWSEAEERQRGLAFDAWLTSQLGEARTFSWGQAWAGYDSRSGGSSIVVRYQ